MVTTYKDWYGFKDNVLNRLDAWFHEHINSDRLVEARVTTNETDIATNAADIVAIEYSSGRDQALVKAASNKSISTSTTTAVTFGTSVKMPTGYAQASSNTTVTVPQDGLYVVEFQIRWANNGTGVRSQNLVVNGSNTYDGHTLQYNRQAMTSTTSEYMSQCTVLELNTSDAVGVDVFQNSGGSLNVESGSSHTWLKITRIK